MDSKSTAWPDTCMSMYIMLICSILIVWTTLVASVQANPPKGHLKPLGHQTGGMIPVDETVEIPGSQEFYDNYVKKVKPLVFRGAAKNYPAFKKWTDSYLQENYPDLEFRIERKKNLGYKSAPEGDIALGKDTLKNFIETYHETYKFLVSSLPTPMWKDVMILPCLTCGSFKKRILHLDIWMSGGGTSTTLHRDKFQKIQCLINGTKEWKWVSLDDQDMIYRAEEDITFTGFSRFDPDRVDLDKFPNVSKVSVLFANLNPGDCVYVPQKMYHHVKSEGTMNIAVNTQFSLFKYDKKLNFSGCDASKISYKSPLDFEVDWPFLGKGELTFLYPDLTHVLVRLLTLLKRKGENFQLALMFSLRNRRKPNITLEAQEIVNTIRGKSDGNITRDQILNLSKEKLRRIASILTDEIPQNMHELEYFMVSQRRIAEVLSILSKRYGGMVRRADFVKMYTEVLGGTKRLAELCFRAIDDEGDELITREEIKMNFARSVSNYLPTLDGHTEEPVEQEEHKLYNYKPETEYLYALKPLKGDRDTELLEALKLQVEEVIQRKDESLAAEIEAYKKLSANMKGKTPSKDREDNFPPASSQAYNKTVNPSRRIVR